MFLRRKPLANGIIRSTTLSSAPQRQTTRVRLGRLAAVSLSLSLGGAAESFVRAQCSPPGLGATNPVTFVSPANGSMDVARFPVMSVAFQNTISSDPSVLANGIKLFTRAGVSVPLGLRRSPYDDKVAIFGPNSRDHRLDPASEYFLEITLGTSNPSQATRVHFTTGDLKSVFCIQKETVIWSAPVCPQTPVSEWRNSCDENYYRRPEPVGDPVLLAMLGTCSLSPPPIDPDSSCNCSVQPWWHLGGGFGMCFCSREDDFALFNPALNYAVIKSVDPPSGYKRSAAELSNPVTIKLDRDIGTSAASYVVDIEDITRGDQAPINVFSGTPTYTASPPTLTVSYSFAADKRYRIALSLSGTTVPAIRILSVKAHRFDWTFNTWSGPQGHLVSSLPTPRTEGVTYPTDLPRWPHLRFLYDGPVACGLGDLNAPPLILKHQSGTQVNGVVSWIDQDLGRLHFAAYEPLIEGDRYDVLCAPWFAAVVGSTCDGTTTPLARFTTQVPPPTDGTNDVRAGSRFSLPHVGEVWLAVRPTVINHPYGLKERYTDDGGPKHFLGHVMLVPEAPTDIIGNISVVPKGTPGCRVLAIKPDPRCGTYNPADPGNDNYYIAAATSCTPASCGITSSCEPCPAGGNAACPAGQSRCRWTYPLYRTELTNFCRDIIDGGQNACSLEDAYRCVGGGTDGCDDNKNRMNATSDAQCPSTHKLDTDPNPDTNHNCVAKGKIAINLDAGDHLAPNSASSLLGVSFNGTSGPIAHPAPVIIQAKSTGGSGLAQATLTGTERLTSLAVPGPGLDLPVEPCKTTGKPGAFPVFDCYNSLGVCDQSTLQCQLIEQGTDAQPSGTCGATTPCGPGYLCNHNQCKKQCTSNADCDTGAGYECGRFSLCVRPHGCATDADCFDGFRCVQNPDAPSGVNLCRADTASASFSQTGSAYTSKWVLIDADKNIWRLWWPDHDTSFGSKKFEFSARIGPTPSGPLTALPLIRHKPESEDCDYLPDPRLCLQMECDAFNDMTYRLQVDYNVNRLWNDRYPAPYGYWAWGYRITSHPVSDPTTESCDVDFFGHPDLSSEYDQDGPMGLFLKLPAGKTPSHYLIEGSRNQAIAVFTDPYDLAIRGLKVASYPDAIYVYDPDNLTIRGNQFIVGRSNPVQSTVFVADYKEPRSGESNHITFDDNYLQSAGAVNAHLVTTEHEMVNNLFWQGETKLSSLSFDCQNGIEGHPDPLACNVEPDVCFSDGTAGACREPLCLTNVDCRIPFWDGYVPGSLTDKTSEGTTATCDNIVNGIGRCSHGIVGQMIFTDNVLLDGAGFQGPWYNTRIQRNHLENITVQEVADGGSRTSYFTYLNNAVFNSTSGHNALLLGAWPSPDPAGRNIAVEGNAFIKNAPQFNAQNFTKHYPGDSSAWTVTVEANQVPGPTAPEARSFRMVGNTFLGRPGGREWGEQGPLAIVNWRDSFVSRNTSIVDNDWAYIISDLASSDPLAHTSGTVENNLILSSTRQDHRENMCAPWRQGDIHQLNDAAMDVLSNFVLSRSRPGDPGDPDDLCLTIGDRTRMFREPLPKAPIVDYETYQRHIVESYRKELDGYHAWPSYDPSLLDDVLQVRPKHAACSFGASKPDACTDLDPDSDLYESSRDNCPSTANPNQSNADSDSPGDACDTCTDSDGDGFGDPGYPFNTCQTDNCPTVANPNQADGDGDGKGDRCDGAPPTTNPTVLSSEGTFAGPIVNVQADPDADLYQALTEARSAPNKPYKMSIVYKITVPSTFQNIPLLFKIEALDNSNDGYEIRYAAVASTCPTTTNNSGWSTPLLTLPASASEPGTLLSASVGSASTSVWCFRIQDTLRNTDTTQSTLNVDRIFLLPQ